MLNLYKGVHSPSPHGTSPSPEPEDHPRFKRQRTLSPDRRGASEKMKRRERTRADEMTKRFNARKEHRNRQFMDEILDGIPEYVPTSDGVYFSCSRTLFVVAANSCTNISQVPLRSKQSLKNHRVRMTQKTAKRKILVRTRTTQYAEQPSRNLVENSRS